MLCLKTAPQLFGVQHAPLTLFLLCSLLVAMAAFVKSQCMNVPHLEICPSLRNIQGIYGPQWKNVLDFEVESIPSQ